MSHAPNGTLIVTFLGYKAHVGSKMSRCLSTPLRVDENILMTAQLQPFYEADSQGCSYLLLLHDQKQDATLFC